MRRLFRMLTILGLLALALLVLRLGFQRRILKGAEAKASPNGISSSERVPRSVLPKGGFNGDLPTPFELDWNTGAIPAPERSRLPPQACPCPAPDPSC